MQATSKKSYKSIGQILKHQDFETLNNDLKEIFEEKGFAFKDLIRTTEKEPYSELDKLLSFLPQYAVKYEENDKKEKVATSELLPGALDCLNLLLEMGANVNAYLKNGISPFFMACQNPSTEIINVMINNKKCPADVKHQDGMCNDALYYATMSEQTEVLEYLVKKGGLDINRKNFVDEDQTVLFHACGYGLEKSVDKLLELGIDPTIKNSKGYQAFQMILPAWDEEVRQELLENEEAELVAHADALYEKMVNVTKEFADKKKASRPKVF